MSVSIKLLLKNKKMQDQTYPIILQLLKDGKSKVLSTGISCLKEQWDGTQLKKSHPNYQKRNLILSGLKQKALKIIDEYMAEEIDFSLMDFENKFKGDRVNSKVTVYEHFQDIIERMKKSNRLGNARSYKDTCNSFFNFEADKNLSFRNLNVSKLENYEAYLRSRNNQDSGIAFKMRAIRAVYNSAIRNGIVKKEEYPFENYKISKLKGVGIKRALSRSEIKSMLDVDITERPDLIDTKNYFIVSYFARGINWTDLIRLKKTDIQGEYILYMRSKTKKRFMVKILPPVQQVLDYYRNKGYDTHYLFPVLLSDELSHLQIENRKHKTLKKFNKKLKELAKLANVAKSVSSYTLRHSYATNLKQLGVSIEKISESLGHSNVDITNSYLKDFETEEIDIENEKLLNFNNYGE
jgi:integrase/recombinase XerD